MKIPKIGRILIVVVTLKAVYVYATLVAKYLLVTGLATSSGGGFPLLIIPYLVLWFLLCPFAVFGYLAYAGLAIAGNEHESSNKIGALLVIGVVAGLLLMLFAEKHEHMRHMFYGYLSLALLVIAAIDLFNFEEDKGGIEKNTDAGRAYSEESARPRNATFGIKIIPRRSAFSFLKGIKHEVLVEFVYKESEANKIGIRKGDVIKSINGVLVTDCGHAVSLLRLESGARELLVSRNKSIVKIGLFGRN